MCAVLCVPVASLFLPQCEIGMGVYFLGGLGGAGVSDDTRSYFVSFDSVSERRGAGESKANAHVGER